MGLILLCPLPVGVEISDGWSSLMFKGEPMWVSGDDRITQRITVRTWFVRCVLDF